MIIRPYWYGSFVNEKILIDKVSQLSWQLIVHHLGELEAVCSCTANKMFSITSIDSGLFLDGFLELLLQLFDSAT